MTRWCSTVAVVEKESRGRSVVARERLQKGTAVLCDSPLLCAASSTCEAELVDAVNQNTVLGRVLIDTPSDVHGMDTSKALRQLYANAFFHTDSRNNAEYICLYEHLSLFNHSCAPNAKVHTRFSGGSTLSGGGGDDGLCCESTVVTLRDVEAGEEITICYRWLLAPRSVRREYFRRHYGFCCDCARCVEPLGEDVANDEDRQASVAPTASDKSPVSRRLEKLFAVSVDPGAQRFVQLSAAQREVLCAMATLCRQDDIWGVFTGSSRYWKGAILRAALLALVQGDDLNAGSLSKQERDTLEARNQEYIIWFFNRWGSLPVILDDV